MSNKYQDLFQSLSFKHKFRPAVHLDYIRIDDYVSELLSGIFDKDIHSESERCDFYDWSIKIHSGHITADELEILYGAIGANEYDRKAQSDITEDDEPIIELCQMVSHKLFSKIMPFEVSASFADDDGVWFLDGMTDAAILKNIKKGNK